VRPVNPKSGISNRRIAGLLAALTLVVLARLLVVLPVFDTSWILATVAGYVVVLGLLALIVLRGGAHRWVAWLALAAAALHAGVLLWLESALRDRHLQLSAPTHMLAAWLAGAVLLALWITALPALRKRTGWHFVSFRRWHIALAVLALLLTGYHALTRSVVLHHPALRSLAQESPLRTATGNACSGTAHGA
jgi:hypothetical protein